MIKLLISIQTNRYNLLVYLDFLIQQGPYTIKDQWVTIRILQFDFGQEV